MLQFLPRSPWWPIAVLALVALVGGWTNSESAHGVIVADANGLPVKPQDVFYGSRHYRVGDDGVYDIQNLPRGARFSVIAQGFGRAEVPATSTEVRLTTAVITFNIADNVTGDPVKNPEARIGTSVVGRGTESGIMVVAPAPSPGTNMLICAAGYESQTVQPGLPSTGIRLAKGGSGCPPLPGASPSPGATPGPEPTPKGTEPP